VGFATMLPPDFYLHAVAGATFERGPTRCCSMLKRAPRGVVES